MARYNSTSFTYFENPNNDAASISVRALLEASDGTIWVGGTGVFYYRDNVLKQFTDTNDYLGNAVRCFVEDNDGDIFVGSSTGLSMIRPDGTTEPLIKDITINSLTNNNGIVWAIGNDGKIYIVGSHNVSEQKSIYDSDGDVVSFLSISLGTDNQILAGSTSNEVYIFNSLDDYKVYTVDCCSNINAVYEDSESRIWCCGDTGLGVLKAGNDVFEEVDCSFSGFFINMIEDYEGNFWFACSRGGILELTPSKVFNPNYFIGLVDETVNSIEIYDNYLYVGTDNGLYIYDEYYNVVDTPLSRLLSGIRIRGMYIDSKNYLYICTYKKYGVIRFDGENVSNVGVKDKSNSIGLSSSKTRCVYELNDGKLAIGTSAGFAIVKDWPTIEEEVLTDDSVLCLSQDSIGKIYVGMDGEGLLTFDETNYKLSPFFPNNEGLENLSILKLSYDSKNATMWISAGNDTYICKSESTKPIKIIDNGGKYGSVYDYVFEGDNVYILRCSAIIVAKESAIVTGESCETTVIKNSNGLTSNVTSNCWSCVYNSTLYIPTISGIYLFDTETYYINKTAPRVIIDSIIVDGTKIENPTGKIKIDKDAKVIVIEFSLLSFNGGDGKLIYQLVGLDDSQIESTSNHLLIQYTNLSGGTYEFNVSAYNDDNVMCGNNVTLEITKEYKLFEQAWF